MTVVREVSLRIPGSSHPEQARFNHLQSSSPAVDASATGLSPNLDNVPRPFGSAYDMGVFEFIPLKVFLLVIVR